MKKIAIVFIFLLSIKVEAQKPLGSWRWQSEKGNNQVELSIKIFNKKHLEGTYCSIFYNGNKIDCDPDIKNNFNLNRISENRYQGIFISNFSQTKGILKLTYKPSDHQILLEVVKMPKGEFYLPEKAILKQ